MRRQTSDTSDDTAVLEVTLTNVNNAEKFVLDVIDVRIVEMSMHLISFLVVYLVLCETILLCRTSTCSSFDRFLTFHREPLIEYSVRLSLLFYVFNPVPVYLIFILLSAFDATVSAFISSSSGLQGAYDASLDLVASSLTTQYTFISLLLSSMTNELLCVCL